MELDGVAHCCTHAHRPAAGLVKVNGYCPRAHALHADREEDHNGVSSHHRNLYVRILGAQNSYTST